MPFIPITSFSRSFYLGLSRVQSSIRCQNISVRTLLNYAGLYFTAMSKLFLWFSYFSVNFCTILEEMLWRLGHVLSFYIKNLVELTYLPCYNALVIDVTAVVFSKHKLIDEKLWHSPFTLMFRNIPFFLIFVVFLAPLLLPPRQRVIFSRSHLQNPQLKCAQVQHRIGGRIFNRAF